MLCERLTTKNAGFHNITQQVMKAVEKSNIREGLCVVFTSDAEAGILITSKGDPRIYEDIAEDYTRVFPPRTNYEYKANFESAAAHSKSAVAGVSIDVIIHNGKALLGENQEIVLADYVGNKECDFMVSCTGNKLS